MAILAFKYNGFISSWLIFVDNKVLKCVSVCHIKETLGQQEPLGTMFFMTFFVLKFPNWMNDQIQKDS